MFDGGGELLFIVLIILLLFGPKKIPELMRNIGSGLRHFRRAQEDLTRQIRDISTQDPTESSSATPTVSTEFVVPDAGPDASTLLADDEATDAEGSIETPDQTSVITPTPAPATQPRPRRSDTSQEPPHHD
jgi:sec-independent protein translocase protein TatA